MSQCNDIYYLDAVDLWIAYGFAPSPDCAVDILSDWPLKERYTHDWKDENGIETDLDVPAQLNNKQITLKGHIYAVSLSDYSSKRAALFNACTFAGTKALYHAPSNITHYVFCKVPPKVVDNLTPIRNTNKIVMQVEIVFEAQHESQTGIPVVGTGDSFTIIGAS